MNFPPLQSAYDALNFINKDRVILANKKYFHIDGFPRQGNNTLRELMLRLYPTMCLMEPLQHNPDQTQKAIDRGDCVICSIRNPVDCITSFVSMIQKDHGDWSPHHLEEIFELYNKYCLCIIKNYFKIIVVDFEKTKELYQNYITRTEKNNDTLKLISKKYSIQPSFSNTNTAVLWNTNIIKKTSNLEVKNQLYTDAYFLDNIEKLISKYRIILNGKR